jgi:CxxC-x17-CxxC domain-containing protein
VYSDETLRCSKCGEDFVFSAGEKKFFDEKGFTNRPGRCSPCRGKRAWFSATCDQCGSKAQLPFEPTEGRPVYCRSCFSTRNDRY